MNTPYSTLEYIFKNWMTVNCPLIQNAAIETSLSDNKLILGVDDFAIRKGHTYNTGIYDLRNESLLDVIPGRKFQELMSHKNVMPELFRLNPFAIVMDLAKSYHKFAREVFPSAIRIADRFHVNSYVIDALQAVRKNISNDLSPASKKLLKQNRNLLNKRADSLNENEQQTLKHMLNLSAKLNSVYQWKEALINWYDNCININQAKILFDKWCLQGYSLQIEEVDTALKTFENWEQEILNYHKCSFTNGIVEGRNNKIKAIQRRHYFTRNKKYYKYRIILECNSNFLAA
jgi:transposase